MAGAKRKFMYDFPTEYRGRERIGLWGVVDGSSAAFRDLCRDSLAGRLFC